jgi:hypothetical protein
MKFHPLCLLAVLLLTACASTVDRRQTRIQERSAAYTNLSPEFRAAVDRGEIKVGMPTDAVYMAWGKPNQILKGESGGGTTETWIYQDTQYATYPVYGYGYAYPYHYYPGYYYGGYWGSGFASIPRSFLRAEVRFENGAIKDWRAVEKSPK